MFQLRLFSVASEGGEPGTAEKPRQHPIVVANPPGDRAFRALIDRFMIGGGGSPEDLEAILRSRFPASVVRRRELAGERFEVWYVYRDGHWIRSSADAPARR